MADIIYLPIPSLAEYPSDWHARRARWRADKGWLTAPERRPTVDYDDRAAALLSMVMEQELAS